MRLLLALGFAASFALQSTGYRATIDAFRGDRAADIGGPNGWASLVALHWVTPGTYTIGRASSNLIVLPAPSAPDRLGTLTVHGSDAVLDVASGVDARVKGQPVTHAVLHANADPVDGVTVGGMTMVTIVRGTRLALRVWDRASEAHAAFQGLKWYPVDAAWRLQASFTPHTSAPPMRILNVLGDIVPMANPGSIEFTIGGTRHRLEALLESSDAKELFFMFRDGTSNKTTYGTGRYLYTDLPKGGRVVIDFNRAINPPCAFTTFATCPLPPAANRLTVPITAGELLDGHS